MEKLGGKASEQRLTKESSEENTAIATENKRAVKKHGYSNQKQISTFMLTKE